MKLVDTDFLIDLQRGGTVSCSNELSTGAAEV